jgi:hypothetical protein
MLTQRIKTYSFIGLFIFGLFFSPVSIAGEWRDDFNDGNLDGWMHPSSQVKNKHWNSSWKSQGCVLEVTIDAPVPGKPWPFNPADFLQLTACETIPHHQKRDMETF